MIKKNTFRFFIDLLASLVLWLSVWAFIGNFLMIATSSSGGPFGMVYSYILIVAFTLFFASSYILYKIKINDDNTKQQGVDKWFTYLNLLVSGLFILNVFAALISRMKGQSNTPLNIFFSTNELPAFPEEYLRFLYVSMGLISIMVAIVIYLNSLLKGKNVLFKIMPFTIVCASIFCNIVIFCMNR